MKRGLLLGVVVLVVAGCGGGGKKAAQPGTISIDVGTGGCTISQTSLPAGPVTLAVHVQDGNTVAELELLRRPVVLVELENLSATKAEYRVAADLTPGPAVLSCPGAKQSRTALTITGVAAKPTAKATAAVERYRTWVEGQARQLVLTTNAFGLALRSGNVADSEAAYERARVYYERVEPIAESFARLDKAIDARAGDVPAARWTGFHPIERQLWARHTTKGTNALASTLFANVTAVGAVATRLQLTPAQIANGATGLLGEVSKSKITGEEERYSHIDLVDFEANLEGAHEAFGAVRPLLPKRSASLGALIERRFAETEQVLSRYRRGDTFVRYGALTRGDTLALSRSVDALAEPLSRVASLVQ